MHVLIKSGERTQNAPSSPYTKYKTSGYPRIHPETPYNPSFPFMYTSITQLRAAPGTSTFAPCGVPMTSHPKGTLSITLSSMLFHVLGVIAASISAPISTPLFIALSSQSKLLSYAPLWMASAGYAFMVMSLPLENIGAMDAALPFCAWLCWGRDMGICVDVNRGEAR